MTTIWNIWKTRRNLIFEGLNWDPLWIASSSISQVKGLILNANFQRDMFFFNILISFPTHYCVFSDASWLPDCQIGGGGLIIVNFHKSIEITGCFRITVDNSVVAELVASKMALKIDVELHFNIAILFTDFPRII